MSGAATQRCSYKKVSWKYVENLQENTHAEVALPNFAELYWNYISPWLFSCKFAAYFHNSFS